MLSKTQGSARSATAGAHPHALAGLRPVSEPLLCGLSPALLPAWTRLWLCPLVSAEKRAGLAVLAGSCGRPAAVWD